MLIGFLYGYLTCCTIGVAELERQIGMQNSSMYIQKIVRAMQVLHANWEICFKNELLPAFMCFYTALGVFGFFGIVKLSGIGAVKMGVAGFYSFTYLLILFGSGGRMEESSARFLRKWSTKSKIRIQSRPKWTSYYKGELKMIRSVRGLRVYVGNAFYVENFTVMKIGNILISTTVTLILM